MDNQIHSFLENRMAGASRLQRTLEDIQFDRAYQACSNWFSFFRF